MTRNAPELSEVAWANLFRAGVPLSGMRRLHFETTADGVIVTSTVRGFSLRLVLPSNDWTKQLRETFKI